jgi:hypothetical protein
MPGSFQITSANIGQTLDTDCLLMSLTYNVAPLILEPPQSDASTNFPSKGALCLSDNDRQIFNLNTFTNSSFAPVGSQPPAGQAINFGSGLPVGALIVRACPVGAVWTAVTQAAPTGIGFPDWSRSSVFDAYFAAEGERARGEEIIRAERIRTARPPPGSIELMRAAGVEVSPPPDPPPPDPLLVEASRKAAEIVAMETAARAMTQGPVVIGRSRAEIETELLLVAGCQRAEMTAGAASNEMAHARAKAITEAKARDQAEATALLQR